MIKLKPVLDEKLDEEKYAERNEKKNGEVDIKLPAEDNRNGTYKGEEDGYMRRRNSGRVKFIGRQESSVRGLVEKNTYVELSLTGVGRSPELLSKTPLPRCTIASCTPTHPPVWYGAPVVLLSFLVPLS